MIHGPKGKPLCGPNGKPLQKTKAAKAVFFMSENGEDWTVMSPEIIPEPLKDKDVMGYLMAGEILESPDNTFYRVERI